MRSLHLLLLLLLGGSLEADEEDVHNVEKGHMETTQYIQRVQSSGPR